MRVVTAILMLVSTMAIGTNSYASMPSPAELVRDVPVEIIEVTGSRPIGHYRSLMREAEERYYQAYNQLTQTDDFKVTCERKRRSFSRIQKRKCEANFVDRILADSNQLGIESGSSRGGMANLPTRLELDRSLLQRRQQQIADAYKVLVENEQLRQSFALLIHAREAYQDRKVQQWGPELVAKIDTDALVPELKNDRPAGR